MKSQLGSGRRDRSGLLMSIASGEQLQEHEGQPLRGTETQRWNPSPDRSEVRRHVVAWEIKTNSSDALQLIMYDISS